MELMKEEDINVNEVTIKIIANKLSMNILFVFAILIPLTLILFIQENNVKNC